MKIKIIEDNNPKMRLKSMPVELPLKNEDKELLDSMMDYLVKSQDEEYCEKHKIRSGVGLAAIQVGVLKRMFCVYVDHGEQGIFQYELVNPKIIETSIKKCAISSGEGCLSVKNDHQGLVHRYLKIKMSGYDALTDKMVTITAREFDAVVLQHEYDHLDGIFYYDRIDKNNPNKQLENEELL